MRVLILGGTGLIGRHLGAELAGAGHEVVVLSRDPARHPNLPAGVRAVRWDGRSSAGWEELAEGAGAIVNLAGENLAAGRWTDARKRRLRTSRLDPGAAVVQAVTRAKQKPAVVVQASAIGYYGSHGDLAMDEKTLPGSDFLARLCVEWESSTGAVEGMGVRRVVVRSAPVLARDEGILRLMRLPFSFFVGGPVAGGEQWVSWIHLADEVAALRFLIENEAARGAFNLAAPGPVSNARFERALGVAVGRPSWFPTPGFLVRLVFGEMADLVLASQRVLPRRLQAAGYAFRYSEPEVALRELLR